MPLPRSPNFHSSKSKPDFHPARQEARLSGTPDFHPARQEAPVGDPGLAGGPGLPKIGN